MNNEIKKLAPAVSYVCTKTQKWQKYEAFIIEELALDDGIEIVFEYRDYENIDASSGRQGFERMVSDINNNNVPHRIVVNNRDCLPQDLSDLNTDVEIIEIKYISEQD